MCSWMRFDPSTEIAKLKIPVLIVQGDHDIQVETEQGNMLKKACPSGKLLIVKGMNHILKQAPEERNANIVTYSNPSLPLESTFMTALVRFVQSD